MREFELIRQIQQKAPVEGPGVVLGIGDDAALLEVPAGRLLVAATDTLNSGRHFPLETEPYDIGFKCLAVNLSDMAAMGAVPHWALLSLSLPEANEQWVASFVNGLASLARTHGVTLVGGDTTSGLMSISVTILGSVEPGRQLQRDGARPGDLIVVSGTVGSAAYALYQMQQGLEVEPGEQERLDRPQPRVELGQLIAGHASACIDVSDGVLADLGHILELSECGARLELDALPASSALSKLEAETRWDFQLSGGDDYELLFTIGPDERDNLGAWSEKLDLKLSIIGEIVGGSGIQCIQPDGERYVCGHTGFEHFGNNG